MPKKGCRRAMIAQPMRGLSDEEIAETRERAIEDLTKNGYEFVNTLFDDESVSPSAMGRRGVIHPGVAFLAKSLEIMATCNVLYLCKGWENARGCRMEFAIAQAYGLKIIHE